MRRLAMTIALAGAVSGCGLLIDEDIGDFDLVIKPKEFVVDAQTWELQVADTAFPAVACSAVPGGCAAGAEMFCTGADCEVSCGESDTCEVLVRVDLWITVSLAVDNPELEIIDDQPIVSVSIKRFAFNVPENTLNVDTPELAVYVAPSNVMSSGSPEARMIGTIPVIQARLMLMDGEMIPTADGKEHLKMFMKDYVTPFNLIVGGTLLIQAGDPIPMGLIRAVVSVEATAGP